MTLDAPVTAQTYHPSQDTGIVALRLCLHAPRMGSARDSRAVFGDSPKTSQRDTRYSLPEFGDELPRAAEEPFGESPNGARESRALPSRSLPPFLITLRFIGLLVFGASTALAEPKYDNLVEIKSVDPTIVVELRYATPRNFTGRALYPPDLPALVRPTTAARLAKAQKILRAQGYGLKIWDAYRPMAVQLELWQSTHDDAFVADPLEGDGSLHTWGVAVDATLVDAAGREVAMPTGFDEFTPKAKLHYDGNDPVIKLHVKILQAAMRKGGFYGERNEWWHFVAYDWKKYAPIREAKKLE